MPNLTQSENQPAENTSPVKVYWLAPHGEELLGSFPTEAVDHRWGQVGRQIPASLALRKHACSLPEVKR